MSNQRTSLVGGRRQFLAALAGAVVLNCAAGIARASDPDELPVEAEVKGHVLTARVTLAQEVLTGKARATLSKSFRLPDVRLGNLVLWRNMRLEEMTVTPRPDSIAARFSADGRVALSVTADVTGHPRYEYDHVWWEWRGVRSRPRRETRTTTGDLSTTLAGQAAFAPTIERRGERILLVLSPAGEGSALDVGDVRVNGINGVLDTLTAGIRQHFAAAAARTAFHDKVLVAREIDLTDRLKAVLGDAAIRQVGVVVADGKAVFTIEAEVGAK